MHIAARSEKIENKLLRGRMLSDNQAGPKLNFWGGNTLLLKRRNQLHDDYCTTNFGLSPIDREVEPKCAKNLFPQSLRADLERISGHLIDDVAVDSVTNHLAHSSENEGETFFCTRN